MSFGSGIFLIGLVGALGPLVIHLLNRQRQMTIDWAAMDLLRQAIRQQRRRLQLRDLLLLLLRTLAIIFFILAMAQPKWQSSAGPSGAGRPFHAVIVVDNSLSMAYTPLDKTLLDLGRSKVATFVRALPSGSDVTLIPMCPQPDTRFAEVYDSREDSLEALARIRVVDRKARLDDLASAVRKATEQRGTVAIKRIVIVSDMQKDTWTDSSALGQLSEMGSVQIVDVGPVQGQARENSWIERSEIRGGYAESGTPCVFDVLIRHQGEEDRRRVRVSLSIAGKVVEQRYVDLAANQRTTVSFEHVFETPGGDFNPAYVPVVAEIEPDRLTLDDKFALITPVFRQAPIVFVDQYGSLEQPRSYRFGESFLLRQLMKARSGESFTGRSITVPHLTLDEVNAEILADTRLLVIAGVRRPTPELVDLLRVYVQRGGQLLITAGADFSPAEWTEIGYADGHGILPVPLASEPIGSLPRPGVGTTSRFHLDPESIQPDVLGLNLSPSQWIALVESPFFYQAVRVDSEALVQSDAETADGPPTSNASSDPTTDEKADAVSQHVPSSPPRVVARYDNGEPFVVLQRLGAGHVMLVTTGCHPKWNNLAVSPQGGILLLDQMLRWLIWQSLPTRTFSERGDLFVPIDPRDQDASFQLSIPGRSHPVSVGVEALGENEFAVVVRDLSQRGVYEVRKESGSADRRRPTDIQTFAVNGSDQESDLTTVSRGLLQHDAPVDWIASSQPISLTGGSLSNQIGRASCRERV